MQNIKNILNAEPNMRKKGLLKKQFNSGVKNAFTRKNYLSKALLPGAFSEQAFKFNLSFQSGYKKAKELVEHSLPEKYKRDPGLKVGNNNFVHILTLCIIKVWKQNLTNLTDYALLLKSSKAYPTRKYIEDALDKTSAVIEETVDNEQDSKSIDTWLKDNYAIYFEKLKRTLTLGSKPQAIFIMAISFAELLGMGFIEANRDWFVFDGTRPVNVVEKQKSRFMNLLLINPGRTDEQNIKDALREYLTDTNRDRNEWERSRNKVPGGNRKSRKSRK